MGFAYLVGSLLGFYKNKGSVMILTEWWFAATTIFVVMATPGPAMLLGLAVATQHGVLRSLYVGSGVLTAFSIFALLSLSGIGAIVLAEPRVLTALRLFGVGYLAWLGTKALIRFKNARAEQSLTEAVRDAEKSSSFFRHGFFMSLSNMNAVLFFTAIFPQFVDGGAPIAPQIGLLYMTFCVCWLVAFMSHALIGATIRQYTKGSSVTRWLHLLSCTIYFAAAGILYSRR